MSDEIREATAGDASILIVDTDPAQRAWLAKVLRRTAGPSRGRADLGPLPLSTPTDLLLVNYDGLSSADRERLVEYFAATDSGTKLLLLSGGNIKTDLVQLLGRRMLTNLLAVNDRQIDIDELIVTTQKILRGDVFGIEKYFIWGVETLETRVGSSDEKARVLKWAEDYASSMGIHERIVQHFVTVADEFFTNAVYDAPIDAAGQPRYAHVTRGERVQLEEHEAVVLKVCCDGQRLGISVQDPFGSLASEQIQDYLAKCMRNDGNQIDNKPGGAGVGLFFIFHALSHFIVNISPGKRTEMIGLIDARRGYRQFAGRHKSLNIFLGN